jgi:hypothetical protein
VYAYVTAQIGRKVFARDFKTADGIANNCNMWMCVIRHGAHGVLILSTRSGPEADAMVTRNTGQGKEEIGILYSVFVTDYAGFMGGVGVADHKEILQNPADI